MRKISRAQICTVALFLCSVLSCSTPAAADSSYYNNSQVGLSLPPLVAPYGQDEVRAMDGTYCRSSIATGGAYVDIGAVGNGTDESVASGGAVYGRLVLPLGKKPRRIDCTALYDLEIQRLRLELQLARMGVASSIAPPPEADWQNSGWTAQGRSDLRKLPK